MEGSSHIDVSIIIQRIESNAQRQKDAVRQMWDLPRDDTAVTIDEFGSALISAVKTACEATTLSLGYLQPVAVKKASCQWLLKGIVFRSWLGATRETLWCCGMPGVGKTVLAAAVVNYLVSTFKDDEIAVLYIFCNYKDQAEQTITNLEGSLLKQLVLGRSTISSGVRSLYEKYSEQNSRPPHTALIQTLKNEVQSYSRTFIVVDALNECLKDSCRRRKLVESLRSLPGNVNLFFTSRDVSAIASMFSEVQRLEILATKEDLSNYVANRILHEYRLSRHVKADPSLQSRIVDHVVQSAEGMFLLAQMHMDLLASKNNRRDVLSALEQLSTELDDIYAEAMKRIEAQNPEDKKLAKEVLAWLSFTVRPLSLVELQHALAIKSWQSTLNLDARPDEGILLSVCAGLVNQDKRQNVVRSVHHTAQEQFNRNGIKYFPNARLKISEACLTYVLFADFGKGACSTIQEYDDRLPTHSFFNYAARHWGDHVREEGQPGLQEQIFKFLQDDGKFSSSRQALFMPDHPYHDSHLDSFSKVTATHILAFFGLSETIKMCLDRGFGSDEKDYELCSPLSWAAENGHDKAVRALLELGADVNAKDKWGMTALHKAARSGHAQVAETLLVNGADANAQFDRERRPGGKHGWTGFYTARIQLAPLWIIYEGSGARTPLHLAAGLGHEGVAFILLANGANIEATDQQEKTALHQAAVRGHVGVMRLLFGKGADIEAEDKWSRTALHLAAIHRQAPVIRLLIEKGANINARMETGSTPLHGSAYAVDREAIILLVDAGADLEAKDREGGTPLQVLKDLQEKAPGPTVWLLFDQLYRKERGPEWSQRNLEAQKSTGGHSILGSRDFRFRRTQSGDSV